MNKDLRFKQLFSSVQNRNGLSISVVFSQFAVKWGMSKNSVRNIYYLGLKRLRCDDEYAKRMCIDVGNISRCVIKPFSDEDARALVCEIDKRVASGQSIRRACIDLADGDVTLMLRYQNKYRTIKEKERGNIIFFDNAINSANNINVNNNDATYNNCENKINANFSGNNDDDKINLNYKLNANNGDFIKSNMQSLKQNEKKNFDKNQKQNLKNRLKNAFADENVQSLSFTQNSEQGQSLEQSEMISLKQKKKQCLINESGKDDDYKMPDNVIPFRKKENALTDSELQSLFMGLVRIVRKSSVADVNNALKEQYNRQSIEMRNLLKSLKNLKDELAESQRENCRLKKEIEIIKMDKINEYSAFMDKIKAKAPQNDVIKDNE